jgi:hypothetical protein
MVYNDFMDVTQDEGKVEDLNLSLIIMRQVDTIRGISSREFHKGIILHGDSGMVRNYLPDVLESYCNAIENLGVLLTPYYDDLFVERMKVVERVKDKRGYHKALFVECLGLLKRLGLLPKERLMAEAIKPRDARKKFFKKKK